MISYGFSFIHTQEKNRIYFSETRFDDFLVIQNVLCCINTLL